MELVYTKKKIIVFIKEVFTLDDENIPTSLLNKSTKEQLFNEYIKQHHVQKRFQRWLKERENCEPYYVNFIYNGRNCTMDDIYLRNTSESEIKYKIHLDDVKIKNVLPMKGNHRCPFCNRTVEGPDKDLLCIDCSKYFRRKHYSKKNEK